jgi:hypothetical protein
MPMKKMLFYVKSCSLFDTFLKYLFNIIHVSSVVCYQFVFKEFCKNITFTLILLIKLYNLEIRFLPKSFHYFQILNLLFFLLLMFQRYKLKLLHQNSFYLFLIYCHEYLFNIIQVSSVVCYKFVFKEFCKNITFTLILLMLILLGNDIPE